MRAVVTGGTGLIGRALVAALAQRGYACVVLSRSPERAAQVFRSLGLTSIQTVGWDARTPDGWGHMVSGQSALINLAGVTPAHWRWTKAYRARILESRLRAGEAVMRAIERCGPPAVLVQASASGFYGDRGDELLTEESGPGTGFRAEVCQAWEASTARAGTRRCVIRTGIVLDCHAGAFPPLLRFARMSGKRLASGTQWVPWIHLADVARAIQVLIEQRALAGTFNLCAPEPATNQALLDAVRQLERRTGVISVPPAALRVLLGELSSVVMDSQRMAPARLLSAGFQFTYPQLGPALRDLLRRAPPVDPPT
jgi:uncharacterized protein